MWDDGLPHFIFKFKKDEAKGGLSISFSYENILPAPYFHKDSNFEICILGNPILDKKINKEKLINILLSQGNNIDYGSIDGEFLVFCYDKRKCELMIFNDRFCSIPLFYFQNENNEFAASVYYTDIWLEYSLYNHIDRSAFFEMMWLHRLLGNKTLDTKTTFLSPSSILICDGRDIILKKYWKPSFKKTAGSIDSCANELVRLLKQSIRSKTSDNPRAGLFLSGGRDSRSVLAAFDKPPVCFTLAVSRNREYQVARKLASLRKAKHVYLRLPEDKYSQIYKKAVRLSGGMYLYDHAIFLDYEEQVKAYADVAFHGYGLDFMFQGMYVPIEYIKILGKEIFIPRLQKINGKAADYYINNIAYRLKGVNLLDYVRADLRDEYFERLRQSALDVLEESDIEFYDNYDKWEYLITHALSRHYTYTNVSSLSTYIEQRTVTFQNDIFDLYLSLPVKYRLDGPISRKALKILNPAMANVISANTGTRAAGSCYEKTLLQIIDGLWKRARKLVRSEVVPQENERTWFYRDPAIRNEPELQQAVRRACVSEKLSELGFLDMDKINSDVKSWLGTEHGGGPFMATLINVNEFLNISG